MRSIQLFTLIALVTTGASQARSMMRSETFDLYKSPTFQPNVNCDLHTQITIDYFSRTAELSEVVGGICEIAVMPNTRVYELDSGRANGDGSITFGERVLPNGQKAQISIRDTRNSVTGLKFIGLTVLESQPNVRSRPLYTLEAKLPSQLSCFGQNRGEIVEVDLLKANGQDVLALQFSRSAGPLLPAFTPVGDAMNYYVTKVENRFGSTIISAVSGPDLYFVGGGSQTLTLTLPKIENEKANLTLSLSNVEVGTRVKSYSVGCQVVK
jgi:hypothetical protein